MEAALIDIEVEVALFEIGSEGLPYASFGKLFFKSLPNGFADSTVLRSNFHVKKIEMMVLRIGMYLNDCSAYALTIDQGFVSNGRGSRISPANRQSLGKTHENWYGIFQCRLHQGFGIE